MSAFRRSCSQFSNQLLILKPSLFHPIIAIVCLTYCAAVRDRLHQMQIRPLSRPSQPMGEKECLSGF